MCNASHSSHVFELLVPSCWHYIVKPLGSGVSLEEVGHWGQDHSLDRSSLTVQSGESELSTLQGFLALCFGCAHDVSSCFYQLNFPTVVNCTFELAACFKPVLLKLLWPRCFTMTIGR